MLWRHGMFYAGGGDAPRRAKVYLQVEVVAFRVVSIVVVEGGCGAY